MPRHVGGLDRIVRIVLGLGLIALAASGTVGARGWLGLLPLATGALGRCPPDTRLGISTCRTPGPRGAGP
jgi:hypothetical protein